MWTVRVSQCLARLEGVPVTNNQTQKLVWDGDDYPKIALIDGSRLVELMIKYRVGVQVKKVFEVVELDEDFFE